MIPRISDILKALEDRGGSLDHLDHAMVWLQGPEVGCYVRARDVVRIETYFRGRGEVWSRVFILSNNGWDTEEYVDKRAPKAVRNALTRAELAAAGALMNELHARFFGGRVRSEEPDSYD